MKLYHFNPNDYGPEWFVMSDNQENAINALNQHLLQQFQSEPPNSNKFNNKPLQWGDPFFKGKEINGVVVRKDYTIDVYEPNQVIESEIS